MRAGFPMAQPLFTEAERQLLITLIELEEPAQTPNNTHYAFYPRSVEEAGKYFLNRRADTAPAVAPLAARGLLDTSGPRPCLTEAGRAAARAERRLHPPIWYWYREYYTLAARSRVYGQFCEELYGRDLSQTNFSDMQQIDFLVRAAALRPGQRALDLGCGRGCFAEYLSDRTYARVTGVDYVPEAVEQAQERASGKRDRLDFVLANMDELDFAPGSFDIITAVDTLYMPTDLAVTLCRLMEMLVPGGRLLAFYQEMNFEPRAPRDFFTPENSALGRAAAALQQRMPISIRTWDFTTPTVLLMQRKRLLAEEMRPAFAAEGTLFLYHHLTAESLGEDASCDPRAAPLSRFLYEIRAPLEKS